MRIRCLAFIPVATLCLAGSASAQNLGDMFKRAAKEARQEIERKVEDKSREAANTLVDAATGTAQAAPGEGAAQRDAGNGSQPSSAASLRGVATAVFAQPPGPGQQQQRHACRGSQRQRQRAQHRGHQDGQAKQRREVHAARLVQHLQQGNEDEIHANGGQPVQARSRIRWHACAKYQQQ